MTDAPAARQPLAGGRRDVAKLRVAEQVLAAAAEDLRAAEPHVAAVVGDAADRVGGAATLLALRESAGPSAARRAAARALRDLYASHDSLCEPPADATPVDESTQ